MPTAEKIYTIPINEAFNNAVGCPVCYMRNVLEKNAVEFSIGDAMMEPDVRISMNELGFCERHFADMFHQNAKLPLGLILETHLTENIRRINKCKNPITGNFDAKKAAEKLKKVEENCFICSRIENFFQQLIEVTVYLYTYDESFRPTFEKAHGFCLPHYRRLLEAADKKMNKRELQSFVKVLNRLEDAYLSDLLGDVQWFTKKFDYRFANEDWKNSKDALERAITVISSRNPKA